MKKIFVFTLALMLIVVMTIPAYAATPSLGVPDMPEIPDISDDIKIELPDDVFDDYIPDIDTDVEVKLPDNFWDNWFKEHPLIFDFSNIKLFGK